MRYNYDETGTTLVDPTTRLLPMQPSVLCLFRGKYLALQGREKKKAQRGNWAVLHFMG